MALDLNALLGQLTQSSQQRQSAYAGEAQRMNAETDAMAQTMNINLQQAAQVADETARIAGQEAEVVARQQQALQHASTILDLDPENMESALVRSMGEYDFAENERKRVRQQFDQLSSISLLDNPLAYLAAQLQLPQVAQRNNDMVAMRDAAANNIATRQQLLAQAKSSIVVNTADQVKQINLDKAANQRKAADIQLREAEMDNASKISGRRLQAFQLNDKIYDIESDLLSKKLQIGQYMMSMQERAEARAERAAAAAARNEAAKDKAEEEAILNLGLQRVSQAMGLQIPVTVKSLKYQKDPEAWVKAARTGVLGNDLLGTIAFITNEGDTRALARSNPGLATAVKNMTAGIESFMSTAEAELQKENLGKVPKRADVLRRAQDMYADSLVNSASRPGVKDNLTSPLFDPSGAAVFNPYKAQHKMLIDEIAGKEGHPLQNNDYVNSILTAINTAPDKTLPNLTGEQETRAFQALVEQVKKRAIPPEKAAQDVAAYYRFSMAKNRDLYQYDLLNLAPQTRYFVKMPGAGMFAEPINVDLSDPVQVRKAIVETVRGSELKPFTTGVPGIDFIGDFMNLTTGTVSRGVEAAKDAIKK